ncbi:MAG: PAS domain S-box protein [Dehalococcoidales bacterium]|nr:PAS domain S-box protein [Dehalococcoidales bacterium]
MRDIPIVFAAAAAVLLGAISLVIPGILPEMLSGGRFTATADAINITGGILFLSATAFFLARYLTTKNSQEMLFACFSALNAAAALLFPFRLPWSVQWWSWHVLRLVGYVALLVSAFAILKRTVEEDRVREESYRTIVETSIDGFWILDSRGHFIEANAYSRLIGYDRKELLHMAVPDIEAAENPEEVAAHIRKVIENGSDRFETRHRRKNGEIIDVEISAHSLQSGRLFVFARDITNRKKMQQQVILNDRLASIGLLGAGIAHEVGNPLTIIKLYSNNLLKAGLTDEIREDLRIIEEAADRAAAILKNLLIFARPESEGKEPIDVNESIWRVLELRAYDRKVNKIEVSTSFDSELPRIMGNRSKLEQVFITLSPTPNSP